MYVYVGKMSLHGAGTSFGGVRMIAESADKRDLCLYCRLDVTGVLAFGEIVESAYDVYP